MRGTGIDARILQWGFLVFSLFFRAHFAENVRWTQFGKINLHLQKTLASLPGFEPGIFWSVVRRVIHCATSPVVSLMVRPKSSSLLYLTRLILASGELFSRLWDPSWKIHAPGEDRTHDLQISLSGLLLCDYETDALPTALPRHHTWQIQTSEFVNLTHPEHCTIILCICSDLQKGHLAEWRSGSVLGP